MTEREIFLAVLDLPDRAARVSYLDAVCQGDAARRARLESLLHSHETAGSFLGDPAIATPLPTTLPTEGFHDDDSEIPASLEEDLTFFSPPSRPNTLGRIGHYDVLELLGRGGFGIVFRAFDTILQRVVAVKVLAPQRSLTPLGRNRFLREARASARVRHEHVVQVYAVEELPLPYLVMEYIPGETLQARLERGGPLPPQEVARLGQQIAEGLHAAHCMGLIHRDIKPCNILIEEGPLPRVKITDFGLARTADDRNLTQSGLLAGTPMFMSPEQAKGESVDHRTDLFSLGSVLYTMTVGTPPFQATNSLAVLRRVAEETPRPISDLLPEVPAGLSQLIARLHATQPDDRFATAQEVANLLGSYATEWQRREPVGGQGERPQVADDRAPSIPPPRSSARRPIGVAMAAALLLGIIGLGLTEAAGVTSFSGTVIRLFSPEGTLIVEVDDPGVSITIDGEDILITGAGTREIRLKPGNYKVTANKDGRTLREELVRVERQGKRAVRISREITPTPTHPDAAEWENAVAALPASKQVDTVVERFRKLNPSFDGSFKPTIEEGKVTGVAFTPTGVTDLSPLRAFKDLVYLSCRGTMPAQAPLADLSPLRGMRLRKFSCDWTEVADLSPLRGMPLTSLQCSVTSVPDLSPLKGMPLRELYCDNCPVADLTPLKGMALTDLNCSYTQITSLEPVRGMALTSLWCNHTAVADLSPLQGMKLQVLTIQQTKVSDLSLLRGMPLTSLYADIEPKRDRDILLSILSLESINHLPTAEFWKVADRK